MAYFKADEGDVVNLSLLSLLHQRVVVFAAHESNTRHFGGIGDVFVGQNGTEGRAWRHLGDA